jgi:hypothetical protein
VHGFNEMDVKRVYFRRLFKRRDYSRWRGYSGRHFVPMRRCFIYPVASTNSRPWSATNPFEMKDTYHDQKVGVWWVITRNRKIRPIFFDGINYERYCEIAHGYFQQGGATIHTARVSMTLLNVRGKNNFKRHLATKVTRPHTYWLLSVRSNERCCLQRQSSYSPLTETKPSQISPRTSLRLKRRVSANKLYTRNIGKFSNKVRKEMLA